MATYHLTLKHGQTRNGEKHSEYIRREGRYAHGQMKEELIYTEYGNLPDWANGPNDFFANADLFERSNGTVYSEFEIALPNELSREENIKLVQEFVKEQIGDNKVYSWAYHEKKAALSPDQLQPHVHIMFCERIIEDKENIKPAYKFFRNYTKKNPQKSGYKKDDRFKARHGVGRENLMKVRQAWEDKVNHYYEKNNIEKQISCKSLKDQQAEALLKNDKIKFEAVNRPAQEHLGPKEANKIARSIKNKEYKFEFLSDKARLTIIAREIKNVAEELEKYRKEIAEIEQQHTENKNILSELKTEIQDKNNEYIEIHGERFISKIYNSCLGLSEQIKANDLRISNAQKLILSEERIERVAVSVYTKGASKRLKKEERKLKEQRIKFEKEFKQFENMAVPKFYQLEYKKEYSAISQRLNKWQNELIEKEKEFKYKKEIFDKEISKPEHQQSLEELKCVIRAKHKNRIEYVTKLKEENKELKKTGRNFLYLYKQILKKESYKIDKKTLEILNKKEAMKSPENVKYAFEKVNRAIHKAHDEKVRGAIKADLQRDIREELER